MSLSWEKPIPIDLSELEGRRFTCIDPCQLCCLCQPELLEGEVPYFRRHFSDCIVAKKSPHRHFALALKQGGGPCTFLEGGRCSIYANRPHYCRQFPFHVHLSNRVQIELDLSCRGVWIDQGEEAVPLGLQLVEQNREVLTKGLRESAGVYEQFYANCREANIDPYPDELRQEVADGLPLFSDPRYLAKVLDLSLEDEEMSLPQKEEGDLDLEALRHAAMDCSLESLSAPDPLSSPVYCDEQGQWKLFMSQDKELDVYGMKEDGSLERIRTIMAEQVPFQALEGAAAKMFCDYLALLNRRDSFLGNAYYLMDEYGYEDPLANVYYGSLATSALDLMWRISLLAFVKGAKLDAGGVREGIIFYDMDRLDAPTIGAFV